MSRWLLFDGPVESHRGGDLTYRGKLQRGIIGETLKIYYYVFFLSICDWISLYIGVGRPCLWLNDAIGCGSISTIESSIPRSFLFLLFFDPDPPFGQKWPGHGQAMAKPWPSQPAGRWPAVGRRRSVGGRCAQLRLSTRQRRLGMTPAMDPKQPLAHVGK